MHFLTGSSTDIFPNVCSTSWYCAILGYYLCKYKKSKSQLSPRLIDSSKVSQKSFSRSDIFRAYFSLSLQFVSLTTALLELCFIYEILGFINVLHKIDVLHINCSIVSSTYRKAKQKVHIYWLTDYEQGLTKVPFWILKYCPAGTPHHYPLLIRTWK